MGLLPVGLATCEWYGFRALFWLRSVACVWAGSLAKHDEELVLPGRHGDDRLARIRGGISFW